MAIEPTASKRLHLIELITCMGILLWSGIGPFDRLTWLLEVLPVMLAAVVLVATYRRFPLSDLTYALIWLHALILMIGGHWTYAEVPLFNWLEAALDLDRNYYDRVGHLAQGFFPAIVAREVLLRTSPLRPGKWLAVLIVAVCLAASAAYELIEWAAAVVLGQGAEQFLGTQGDPWDTQWDMFLALCGAAAGLALLGRRHDRSLRALLERQRRAAEADPSQTDRLDA